MRIAVLSDLHLEIAPFEPAQTDADLVVLAGDIDNGTRGLEWARRVFDAPILYVPGNHEYYGGEFGRVQDELAGAALSYGIELLDCSERIIRGVRFLGCTLWTDYSLAPENERPLTIEQARRYNPDFAAIRFGGRNFAPEDAMELCRRHRSWLEENLKAEAQPTVVITHFAPHRGSIASAFEGHRANPGFIVPLDPLMGRAQLWIHGHTHTAFDYAVDGTRIVCNPRGYPDETTGFAPDRLIDSAVRR
jgi:predicted phosphodiesterase